MIKKRKIRNILYYFIISINISTVVSDTHTLLPLLEKAKKGSTKTTTRKKKSNNSKTIIISSPHDVGLIHYITIDNLKQSFEKNLPRHHDDFLNTLIEELHESFCRDEGIGIGEVEGGDPKCEVNIYKQTLKARSFIEDLSIRYPDNEAEAIHDILPHDFDFEVKQHILDVLSKISSLDVLNNKKDDDMTSYYYYDVMNSLDVELGKLRLNQSVQNENHRQIGMMTIHVGMESMKQWFEVMTDPEHIFFRVPYDGQSFHSYSYSYSYSQKKKEHYDRKRRLEDDSKSRDDRQLSQQQQGFSFLSFLSTVIIRDVLGVIGGAVSDLLTTSTTNNNNSIGFPNDTTSSSVAISGAIAAIISSFIGFFVALGDSRTKVCFGPIKAGCVVNDDDQRTESEESSPESKSESSSKSQDIIQHNGFRNDDDDDEFYNKNDDFLILFETDDQQDDPFIN